MALRISSGLRNKLCGIELNKLTNGAFTSDTTSWTAVDSVLTSVAGGDSGNCLQIATNSANVAKAYQDITTKIGHKYMVIVKGKNGTCATGKVLVGTTGDEDAILETANISNAAWAEMVFDVAALIVFTATATTTRITLQNSDTSNTGLTYLFDTASVVSLARALKDLFYLGFLNIYSGSQPATGDLAPSGNLLVTIYSDGAAVGLSFDEAASGTVSKKSTETWSGTAVGAGTQNAGWFRLIVPGDSGAGSTTDERIDGAVATSGAELNLNSISITNGVVIAISTFQITVPANA
jgi:hypothetical protein